MNRRLISFLACVLVVSGCSKSETPRPPEAHQEAADPSPGNQIALDACTLLTSAEIEALQGEPLQESKSTAPGDKSLAVSQCFFQLPTLTKSISLQVVRPGNTPGAPTAQQVWGEMFAPAKLQEFEKEGGARKVPPRRIPDLGEQAFWMGGPAGGLYVLQGDAYIHLGIGGTDDEETRIKKSTTLAQLVLKRL